MAVQHGRCSTKILLVLPTDSTLREGDLQAMSNTAKCQLSRAVHKTVGMTDDMRVVGELLTRL